MAVYKRQTIVRVDSNIYEKIGFIAFKERRSINEQVEKVLIKYINDYEKKFGEIPILKED